MTNNDDSEELLSLAQAAKYAHVTRQAIFVAIKYRGGLNGIRKNNKWYIRRKDLDEYRTNKFNRDLRKHNGEYVFDMDKGHFSVHQVCKVLSSSLKRPYALQHLYYLIRTGQLKAFKTGYAWVIKKEDAVELLQKELDAEENKIRRFM